MESNDLYTYLTNKYVEYGLITPDGTHIMNQYFDFNIYPDDGYIPMCSVCKEMYDNFIGELSNNVITTSIEAKHIGCNCLWYDYFRNKISSINNNVKFAKNKEKLTTSHTKNQVKN